MTILKDLKTPVFAAEGQPENIDERAWKVEIIGTDGLRKQVSLDDFRRLPVSTVDARLTSVSGWSVRAPWTGVLWKDFIAAFPQDPKASHLILESLGGYTTNVPIKDLAGPHVMWAWGVGGEPLEVEYGGPLRIIIPNLWGYKSCKWVVKMTYVEKDVPGYWETRGYSSHGRIEPGFTLDVNTKERKAIKGGEVVEF